MKEKKLRSKVSTLQEMPMIGKREVIICTKVTALGSYVLFLAFSTVSFSASDSLSEHSVTFEFSDFKIMRLAQFEN